MNYEMLEMSASNHTSVDLPNIFKIVPQAMIGNPILIIPSNLK